MKKLIIGISLFITFAMIGSLAVFNTHQEEAGYIKLPNITIKQKKLNLDSSTLTSAINQLLLKSFSDNELASLSLSLAIPYFEYDYNYNENIEYWNASTIKVPLNMYIYELAQDNPSLLSTSIEYTLSHYEDGSGIMQGDELGTLYDVQTLLNYSIQYSDNIATNMLLDTFIHDLFFPQELIPYFGEANYLEWKSTSNNRMQTLKYLYSHQELFKTLLEDMRLSVYRDRIPRYLPDDVNVANKTGDIFGTIHDFGIVYDLDKINYLITISMDGIENGSDRMAKLSKDIYDLIQMHKQSLLE